jgi:hypothetical protein
MQPFGTIIYKNGDMLTVEKKVIERILSDYFYLGYNSEALLDIYLIQAFRAPKNFRTE